MTDGLTKLTCEFNVIDHENGSNYYIMHVETEVPTVAGDWDKRSEVEDVFTNLLTHTLKMVMASDGTLELDEGVKLYVDGELLA